MIRVAVCGAAGRMGREVVGAIHAAEDAVLVAAIDKGSTGLDAGELASCGPCGVYVEQDLSAALIANKPDVMVDFSIPSAVKGNAITALNHGIRLVIGTTGLSDTDLRELNAVALQNSTAVFVAPNFAIGAVLMMEFAQRAARFMPDVEIIELHHEQKVDSPSGTAMLTAQRIGKERLAAGVHVAALPENQKFNANGARGACELATGEVPVHSVRLPGFVAHQEVIFGGPGQILTIRHDSLNRASFMPGVLMAVRKVRDLPAGLTVGLDALM